ncbi:MAG: MBL fold metallo-hydrolase, partial [Pseudomonadota bacterium]
MYVHLLGVRGSLPRPETPASNLERAQVLLKEFERSGETSSDKFVQSLPEQYLTDYGGNTSCVEVYDGKDQLILDGGSGLKELGMKMMAGPAAKGKAKISILMTHFHWDHMIGLPFFVPLFIPGNEITFYAVQEDLEKYIRLMFTKPYFPVDFSWLPSKINFVILEPRKAVKIQNFDVTPYMLD